LYIQHVIAIQNTQPTQLHLLEKQIFLSSKTKLHISTLGGALPVFVHVALL